MKRCPECKRADKVIKIQYGMPTLETQELSKQGKVKIGGCEPQKERWWCKRCEKEF